MAWSCNLLLFVAYVRKSFPLSSDSRNLILSSLSPLRNGYFGSVRPGFHSLEVNNNNRKIQIDKSNYLCTSLGKTAFTLSFLPHSSPDSLQLLHRSATASRSLDDNPCAPLSLKVSGHSTR